MQQSKFALAFCFTLLIPTIGLCNDSATGVFKVSFTIPASVDSQQNPKTIALKQQITTEQTQIRDGQIVKIQTTVIP